MKPFARRALGLLAAAGSGARPVFGRSGGDAAVLAKSQSASRGAAAAGCKPALRGLAAALLGLALLARPGLACAQGSYLSAPDGNPTNALIVANGGSIGIGTTSPEGRLHIYGNGAIPQLLITGANPAVNFVPDAATLGLATLDGGGLGGSAPGDTFLIGRDNKSLIFGIGTHERMRLNSFGNVGIGTTTPQAKLDVNGDVQILGNLTLETGGNPDLYTGTGSSDLGRYLHVINTPSLRTASGLKAGGVLVADNYSYANPSKNDLIVKGNVGIGTTSPQSKLDVNGKINCTVLELTSDRNAKAGFAPVDNRELLQKVARLPLSTWHHTNAPGVRHLGPMAQDFQAAFHLGTDDKHIATVDADGVLFAAFQGLYELVQEKDTHIAALESKLFSLEQRLAANNAAVEKLLAQQASARQADVESAKAGASQP